MISIVACKPTKDSIISKDRLSSDPETINYEVSGSLTKKLILNIENPGEYAGLSMYADNELLIDDYNVPVKGEQVISCLVHFKKLGNVKIQFHSLDEEIIIKDYKFEDIRNLKIPVYRDISIDAGLDKVSSIKYGGPSVADIDNDGDYDFILNNHNAESSKLYWNNGDGTVSKHTKNLSRWFKHDLHGTALGDYDNDGDLDLLLSQGGGNGNNPSKVNFYLNDEKTLVRYTGDVKIDRGGRGRGGRWIDADNDGDLDVLIINEASLNMDKPQHYFYENKGDGTFDFKNVDGMQDVEESRILVTDFNGDHIDDVIFYSPVSLWKGNGDFSYTNVTNLFPTELNEMTQVMAMTDIDIDNDGDLDLYLTRGKLFEHGKGETPSVDFNPMTKELAIKTRGYKDVDAFDFTAEGMIKLDKYFFMKQGSFGMSDYPIFLGKEKNAKLIGSGEELEFNAEMAKGWPDDISYNGVYFGYLGDDQWKAALVRNGNLFWQYRFSLTGVTSVNPLFVPQNRNHRDILLRNDGTKFTDVSKEWNLPPGGNALGVTVGDFNNDSHQDLFVYRWGRVGARISDYMLLNTGDKSFETTTMHGANDVGGPGNGDMGQAFDFDLDGQIDLLNGSEGGEWYLYSNKSKSSGNYTLVRIGYSPKSNIDPISAEVKVQTAKGEYRKRVGSAGEIFSQSLMNIVHFGLGDEEKIERISIRWRNGETVEFENKKVNTLIDTDNLDPEMIQIEPIVLRKNTQAQLYLRLSPENANSQVSWNSSDEKILSVDQNGLLTALGKPGQSARITATSKANGLTAKINIKIYEWFPLPVKSIYLKVESTKLYVGQQTSISSFISPVNADNSKLTWTIDNDDIISIDAIGNITGLAEGKATVRASTKDNSVFADVEFAVKPYIEPYLKIVDKASFEKKPLIVGDELNVEVNYHAGSGNRVISADEGGIRFWLRHFRSKWIPEKDIILTYEEALNTEDGQANMTISLKGLISTKDLPEGHFYQLRATFTSSDGSMYSDDVLDLQIIDKK